MAVATAVKGFREGTDRLVPPAETVARMRPFLAEIGITRIANVTGLDSIGIPVTVVCRPNSRSLSVSQGKGLTLDAARASGLMESFESFVAERIMRPLLLASTREMEATADVVDVDLLPRPRGSRFHRDLPLLWVEGQDLLQRDAVWVPYECVHTDFRVEPKPGQGAFVRSSNGLASGNHLLEATSHAICEAVERDAGTLWTLLPEAAQLETRIDLDSVDHEGCREVLEKYERAGIMVAAWETTADIAIPSFIAVINDKSDDPLRTVYSTYGSGCHPRRGIALLRALTEAAQSRLTLIAGTRDDMVRSDYDRLLRPEAPRRMRELMLRNGPRRRFDDGCGWDGLSFEEDVERELAALRAAGIERAVCIDLSRPRFGVHVVRMVIPGLETERTFAVERHGARASAWVEAHR